MGSCLLDLFDRDVVPHNFAEDVLFAHATGDQLCVLRTEIENQHTFARHLGGLRLIGFGAALPITDTPPPGGQDGYGSNHVAAIRPQPIKRKNPARSSRRDEKVEL